MSFLYPAFLFASAAIAIPIIIHLVELRKPKRVFFTNVQFIREVNEITSNSRRIKHWLILFSRIFFILSLVLLFAQPFLPAANSAVDTNGNVAVYIDNSFSMQAAYVEDERSLLEAATDQSKQLANLFPKSSNFFLLTNYLRPLASLQVSKSSFIDDLSEVEYIAKVPSSQAIFSSFSPSASFITQSPKQVFIYSDFQKSSFDLKQIGNLDTTKQYVIVPLAQQTTRNAFVDSVFINDEFIRAQQTTPLKIRVFNSGDEVINGCPVKVFIDDKQVSALSLDINPKQYTEAEVSFRLNDYSPKLCRIEIEDYPVSFDNVYYFTLQASSKINVLEITSEENSEISQLYKNEPVFDFKSLNLSNLNFSAVEKSDLVIVNGLTNPDAALAENLQKFVQTGGSVVVIPAASNYTDLESFLTQLGIRNLLLRGVNANKMELAVPDPESPFFQNVFSDFDRKMLMPKATPVLSWTRSALDILKFRQGANFLSGFRQGNGMVYVFASPMKDNFSDFASHSLFVPVMYKLAMRSFRSAHDPAYTLGSSTIRIPVEETDMRKGVYKLVLDSLEIIPEQQIRNGQLLFTTPAEMTEAGFYQLQHEGKSLATLAFNYNKSESFLEQYTAREIREAIPAGYSNIQVYDTSDGISVKDQFEKQNFGVPLWKYCLILCLIFLLTEILLIRFL